MNIKKFLLIAVCALVVFASCNRKRFDKQLDGTWSLSQYLYAGKNETASMRDTLMNQYKLLLNSNQSYLESWRILTFTPNLHIVNDTLGYDSTLMTYTIKMDTFDLVDTSIAFHASSGRYDVLNSESDLQLKEDSTNTVRIYQILKLTGSVLNIRNGNEELDLTK